jgi:hypothetical protein
MMKLSRSSLRLWVFLACALLTALAFCAAVQATTFLRMSVAEMARRAPLIVRGQCLGSSVTWEAGEIWTLTNFEVVEVWRGSASGTITVRLLGGTTGNLTSVVSGVPRFHSGDEAILFLEATVRGDYSVLSWEQGTFRIRRDRATKEERVEQNASTFTTFDPVTRRFESNGTRNRPLAALRKEIDVAIGNRKGMQP